MPLIARPHRARRRRALPGRRRHRHAARGGGAGLRDDRRPRDAPTAPSASACWSSPPALSMLSALVEAVKAAGLKPDGIDLSAFALVRMLGESGTAASDPDHPARAICHLGGVTNLAIAVGEICLFTRPLQTAWDDDEAVASSVAEEIRLSLDFYAASPDARPVDSMVLSGPGAERRRRARRRSRSGPASRSRSASPSGAWAPTPCPPGRPLPLHRGGRPGARSGRHEARQPASRRRAPACDRRGARERFEDRPGRARAAAHRRRRVRGHQEPGQRPPRRDREGRAGEGRRPSSAPRASRPSATSARSSRPACTSITDLATKRFDWERFMRELALVLPEQGLGHRGRRQVAGAAADASAARPRRPRPRPPAAAPPPPRPAAAPPLTIAGCAPTQNARRRHHGPAAHPVPAPRRSTSRTPAPSRPSGGSGAATRAAGGAGLRHVPALQRRPSRFAAADGTGTTRARPKSAPSRLGGGA